MDAVAAVVATEEDAVAAEAVVAAAIEIIKTLAVILART